MVGIAQLVRAPDCGSGGRGFKSHYPPHPPSGPLRAGVVEGPPADGAGSAPDPRADGGRDAGSDVGGRWRAAAEEPKRPVEGAVLCDAGSARARVVHSPQACSAGGDVPGASQRVVEEAGRFGELLARETGELTGGLDCAPSLAFRGRSGSDGSNTWAGPSSRAYPLSGSAREEPAHVPEALELERVPGGVAQEERPLLARLALEAGARRDDEVHPRRREAIA